MTDPDLGRPKYNGSYRSGSTTLAIKIMKMKVPGGRV
jgi:hypothetical protein